MSGVATFGMAGAQEQMSQNNQRRSIFLVLFFLILTGSNTLLKAQLNPVALPQAMLLGGISSSDTFLNVDNAALFPASGFVAIETEVLAYSSHTATAFVISARAQVSTIGASHASGAVVILFPASAGLLTQSIDAAATTLNINSTVNFPAGSGSVIIDQEIITYGGGTTTTLTSLTRGQQGTAAEAHNAGAVIIGRVASPQTQTYILPRFLSASDNFSGIALANLSDGPANIVLTATSSDGTSLTVPGDSTTTTQVTKSYTLGPRQQFVGNLFDLLGDVGGATDFYGQLFTGNPNTLGVVDIGDVDSGRGGLYRLDLAPFALQGQTDSILPVALQGSLQYGAAVGLEIGIIAEPATTSIVADYVDAYGNVALSTTLTTTANQRLVKELSDIFPNLANLPVETGYVHLTSSTGFVAYENILVGKENGYLQSISRTDASTSVMIPLAISVGPYLTRLIITDGTDAVAGQTSSGVVNVTITAYNPDGSLLAGAGIANPAMVTFPVSGQYSNFLQGIFHLSSAQSFFGYLKIDLAAGSSTSGFTASALILNTDRNQLTALPGQLVPRTHLTLTPALFDPSITTALSLVNWNTNNASVKIDITRGDGTVRESQTINIPGRGQVRPVLSALFPDIAFTSDGYVSITSSQPIFGMIVFDNGVFLASGYPLFVPDPLDVYPNPVTLATPNSSSVPASASTYPLTIEVPNPAPAGGLSVNLQLLNSVIASIPSSSVLIPEGQTSVTVPVSGYLSGATVLNVSAPGFMSMSVVVNVQNVTDFTQARNITISPRNITVQSGDTVQFSLSYDAVNQPAVTWDVGAIVSGDNSQGTITQSGLYSAPLLLPSDQPLTVQVNVINVNTTYFTASTFVTILPPPAS
jgi:hypothetical protein